MEKRRILLIISFILVLSLLLGVVLVWKKSKSKLSAEPSSQEIKSKSKLGEVSTSQGLKSTPASYEGMVLIPEATFVFKDRKRNQKVSVHSFYVDQYEVTVEAFMKFLKATGYRTSAAQEREDKLFNEVNSPGGKYPVGFVSLQPYSFSIPRSTSCARSLHFQSLMTLPCTSTRDVRM